MLTLEQIRDASELRLKLRIRAKNLEAVGRRQKAPERIPAIDLRHAGVAIAEQRDGVIVAGDEALPVSGCLRSAGIGTGFQCWLQEAGKSRQDRRDEGNQGDDPIRHTMTPRRRHGRGWSRPTSACAARAASSAGRPRSRWGTSRSEGVRT